MSARNASPNDDHDSPWKEALELYFSEALALLAPDLHAIIDWLVPVEFLDKELQAVLRASTPGQGRRHADKLVRVRLLGGTNALLLVHVEVQGRLSGPQGLCRHSVGGCWNTACCSGSGNGAEARPCCRPRSTAWAS